MIETKAIKIYSVPNGIRPALSSFIARLPDYLALTKPGITVVVLMTTLTGFMLASPVSFVPGPGSFLPYFSLNWTVLLHTILGTALISAGAGALNMLLEVESDALMRRTKNRPLPSGRLYPEEAFFLGLLSAAIGIVHIAAMVNLSASFIAAVSLMLYLVFYTPMKKSTAFCIIIGAVSGALPPLIGWIAAKGSLTFEGWSLFLILFVWQFPHLLALGWSYRDDYVRANFKMIITSDFGGRVTGWFALISCLILLPVSWVPFWFGLSGIVYLYGSTILGFFFAATSFYFLIHRSDVSAKFLFLTSVLYMPLLLILMIFGR